MSKTGTAKIFLQLVLLIIFITALSYFSVQLWGGKAEEIPEGREFAIQEDMTISQFGQRNGLANPVIKQAFDLQSKQDLRQKLSELNLSENEVRTRINRALALSAEYESKDWTKIPLKFALWITFLIGVFILMRKGKIKPKYRKWLYLTAIIIFGIALGSDPSPMGTVKDAVFLLDSQGVIFLPRMIALAIFLLLVVLANKFICSWGCQFGVLQDLIFRLNRKPKDRKGILRQFKPPFVVTNTIRVLFFGLSVIIAFLWSFDIYSPIDPFKIYNPKVILIGGGIFIGIIIITGLFIYRPWCYFFCPFGLVGWLFEKLSIFKIKVDYDTCIACESCSKACPSSVMETILKREKTISDCFACGNCVDTCPTGSVQFATGRREKPPKDKFTDKAVHADEE